MSKSTGRLRFGRFEANLDTGELSKHGVRLKLHDQPFQVLALLIGRPGELVNREEIRQALWLAGTFVDFENGLNSAVNRLRDVLGDCRENPKYIETVPRHGYRFIAPVTRIATKTNGANGLASRKNKESYSPATEASTRWRFQLALTAGFLAAFALIPGSAWHSGGSSPTAGSVVSQKPTATPLITYAGGAQWLPAFSPDGSRLAYSWQTETGWYLEVKQLGSETRQRLTKQGAKFPPGPAWSPDGSQIAFVRADTDDDRGIFVVPAMGGPERKLRTLSAWRVPQRLVSWSADGRWIAFADEIAGGSGMSGKPRGPNALFLISPSTLETRQLTKPDADEFGDAAPAFSPDGSTIAFVHTTAKSRDEICTIPTAGGTPTKVVTEGLWTNGLTWSADGKWIVFDRSLAGGFWLWKVPATGGKAQRLDEVPTIKANLLEPTVWRDRLAYESHETAETVGMIALNGRRTEIPHTPVASTQSDRVGRFSAGGERIAFISNRTGTDELWVADADGGNTFQLTHLADGPLSDVAWGPDGKSIAVSGIAGRVFLASTETGAARTVFEGLPFTDEVASNLAFARDGKSIYVSSQPGTGEKYELLKVPVGGGAAVKVVDGIITNFAESPDGRFLYYSRAGSLSDRRGMGIWRRPVEGGAEERVAPVSGAWDVGPDGLYLASGHATIERYDFDGRRHATVVKLGRFGLRLPMSVSSDGKRALFGYEQRATIEIDMLQGFR